MECEVVGDVIEIDRAVALIRESIQQSELSRRRKAFHTRQKTRKPAVRGAIVVLGLLPLSERGFGSECMSGRACAEHVCLGWQWCG